MQSYDLLMVVVLVGTTIFGAWKGLAWQVASLGSIVASYVVAVQFRAPVAAAIDAEPPWNMFLAMLILFLGTSLVIWLLFGMVRRFIDQLKIRDFDRQIGALLGLAKGVVLCVIITLFAVTLTSDQRRQQIIDSKSGYYIALLLDRSHAVMPPEVHQVVGPYIHQLDERLETPHYAHDENHWDGDWGETDYGEGGAPAPQWPWNGAAPTLNTRPQE